MMSKNEMKANHNLKTFQLITLTVGKYDVKERDESKSQHVQVPPFYTEGWQI